MTLNVSSWEHKLTERELKQEALKQLSDCTSLKGDTLIHKELQKVLKLFSIVILVVTVLACLSRDCWMYIMG